MPCCLHTYCSQHTYTTLTHSQCSFSVVIMQFNCNVSTLPTLVYVLTHPHHIHSHEISWQPINPETISYLRSCCSCLFIVVPAVADLASFLQLRGRELIPGGLLVITMIGSGGDTDFDIHPYLRYIGKLGCAVHCCVRCPLCD